MFPKKNVLGVTTLISLGKTSKKKVTLMTFIKLGQTPPMIIMK